VRPDPRHEGDDAVDDAAEVDAEHPVPVLVGGVCDVVEEVDPGVVAEDVDVAEDLLGLVRPPSSAVAASRWSARMSAITTFIPAPRNAFAMPRPTPLPPPVTKATFPSTSFIP
jgi:hypothetical protein